MKLDMKDVRVGDWVYSDSPGIWRVFRILESTQRLRFNLQERKRVDRRRLIFSKRLVDESWKPAFSAELATAEFVRALSNDDRRRLEEFIAGNPQTLQEFDAFQPKGIDHAMDLPLNVPTCVGKEGIHRLIYDVFADISEVGLTNDEILQRIAASELAGYAPKTMRNATMRFLCRDHELRSNVYVFREVQLLMI